MYSTARSNMSDVLVCCSERERDVLTQPLPNFIRVK